MICMGKLQFYTQRLFSIPTVHEIGILIVCMIMALGLGCDRPVVKNVEKKLLIYCGITMIRPMTEIAELIERKRDCQISITKGGSGNLLKSILHNKAGDMYLPGSDKYFNIIQTEHPGLVIDKVFVGYNRAAIMVQKGNPLGITSDLSLLADSRFGVIIGNPDSGSIGKETRSILEKRGIFKDVVINAMGMTTDSKNLVKAIKTKEADIVINWYAVSTWDDNPDYIDVIPIAPQYLKKKKLIIGLLKYSKHPDISRELMSLAGSEKGKAIFRKYGLY